MGNFEFTNFALQIHSNIPYIQNFQTSLMQDMYNFTAIRFSHANCVTNGKKY